MSTLPNYDRFMRSSLFLGDFGTYTEIRPLSEYVINSSGQVISILFTDNGPLVTQDGRGDLATIDDVDVTVNGLPQTIFAIDPLPGIIYIASSIPDGASVFVDYHYASNLTFPFLELNNPNYTFNHFGDNRASDGAPFLYQTVSLPGTHQQPQLYQHRYRAQERAYSSLLNDPTLLLFNQDSTNLYTSRFERQRVPFILNYNGDTNPESLPTSFTYIGETPGTLLPNGRLVISDASSGSGSPESFKPSFYKRDITSYLEFNSSNITVNFRLALTFAPGPTGWTGYANGWSDDRYLYFASILKFTIDSQDYYTASILNNTGDESLISSHSSLQATQEILAGDSSLRGLLFTGANPPPIKLNDNVILFNGNSTPSEVYNVILIQGPELTGITDTWRIVVNNPLTGAEGDVRNAFVALPDLFVGGSGTNGGVSLRLSYDPADSALSLFRVGFAGPLSVVQELDLPICPQVYGSLLPSRELFFGSLSKSRALTCEVDFVRWSFLPLQGLESDFRSFASVEGFQFPDKETPPWTLLDNEGSQYLNPGGFLRLQEAGYPLLGSLAWLFPEPLLSDRALARVRARLRVDSFALGIPATLTLFDGVRQLTLSAFADQTNADTTLLTGILNYNSLTSLEKQDILLKAQANLTNFIFFTLSGAFSFEDELWTNNIGNIVSYIDDSIILTSPGYVTPRYAEISTLNPFSINSEQWNLTFNIKADPTNNLNDPQGHASFWLGLEDTQYQVYLAFDYVTNTIYFVDRDGVILQDTFANPISYNLSNLNNNAFHEFRVIRNMDFLSLWVDGTFRATFDLVGLGFPASVSSTIPRARIYEGTLSSEITLDYFFAHSNTHTGQYLGLYKDENSSFLNAPASYDIITTTWLGNFLDIEIERDPLSTVKVFLNGSNTPSFEVNYTDLPFGNTSQEPGLYFGSLDPRSYSNVVWDYVRFELTSRFERITAPWTNLNNRTNVISSGEPLKDSTGGASLPYRVRGSTVFLTDQDRKIGSVLSVTNLDQSVIYPSWFITSSDTGRPNSILNFLAPLPPDGSDVLVNIVESPSAPYSADYLRSLTAETRLEVGTPIVPSTQLGNLTSIVEPLPPLGPTPSFTLTTGSEGVIYNNGTTTVRFILNPERPYYEDLEIYTSVSPTSPFFPLQTVCSSLKALELGTYEETYTIGPDGGFGPSSLWVWNSFNLNGMGVWNQSFWNPITPPAQSVFLTLAYLNLDTLTALSDAVTGELVDYYGGSTWNNPGATWNNATITPSVPFTWNSPNLAPVITPVP